MKISLKRILLIFFFFIHFPFIAISQTLKEEVVKFFRNDNQGLLNEYIVPFSKVLGSTMGNSIYYCADAHSFPHFDFGICVSYMSLSGDLKTTKVGSEKINTVFGKQEEDSSSISGLDIDNFYLPVAHLNFGIGENTDIIIRYVNWNNNKLGDIRIYGAGIKYELENLFSIKNFPLDFGLLAIYQKYRIDNYIEGAVFEMNLLSSKKFDLLPVEFYGGAGYINNVTNVSNPENVDSESISITGLEEIRYQIGLSYSFLLININAELNLGEYTSFSSGIRLVF